MQTAGEMMDRVRAGVAPAWSVAPAWDAAPWDWRAHSRAALAVLVGLVYALVLALNVAALLAPPRLALGLARSPDGRARITWLQPGGALWNRGVRAGDAVLALDGRRPARPAAGAWAWVGERVRARTRAGVTVTVDAALARCGHDTWPLLLLSPWCLLLGTLVLLREPRPASGYAAYALFASAAFPLALAPAADGTGLLASSVESALLPVFAACYVLFFLTFPRPRGPRCVRLLLLLALPLVAVLADLAAHAWPPLYDVVSPLSQGLLGAYLVLGVALQVQARLTERAESLRRGLTIMNVGTAISILPFVALYLLPTLLGRPPLLAAEQAALALAFLPASFAYAILRHQVLPVHLLQRWSVRLALWCGALVLDAAAIYALLRLAGPELSRRAPAPGLLILALAFAALLLALGGALLWLCLWLQRLLDGALFGDGYDYRAALGDLSRTLALAGDLDALCATLPATLRRLLNLRFVVLVVDTGDGPRLRGADGMHDSAALATLLTAARAVRDAPRLVPLETPQPPRLLLSVLVVPLATHEGVVGWFCLGPKASGESVGAADRALLVTLSGHLAAIVCNARLVAELRLQVRARERLNERLRTAHEAERRRLSADLHDAALPLATYLAYQLDTLGGAQDQGQAARLARLVPASRDLTAQLRALCTALRPPELERLGLCRALDDLAGTQGDRAGVPVLLDADPEVGEIGLAPAAELALYRAAQEALTNALRHGQPRTVEMTLRRQGDVARLRVCDDGAGFVVPASFDRLAAEGHQGLAGLRERVEEVGGEVCVTSTPGAGTVVQVEVRGTASGAAVSVPA